ncbi:hypothetical protein AYI69_g979 [Smittium culicis]|uniref:Uncharacterized protein n=1 Tax=Smittium culicis TaxID=133412 RepID=A0A1R1YRJ6_9FUNG|nr:hypothetical protein AYI69_g979 [Smittium culicis]
MITPPSTLANPLFELDKADDYRADAEHGAVQPAGHEPTDPVEHCDEHYRDEVYVGHEAADPTRNIA